MTGRNRDAAHRHPILLATIAAALAATIVLHFVAQSSAVPNASRRAASGAVRALPRWPSLPSAGVTISAHAQTTRVTPSFLGISTEYWTLPAWEHHLALLGRVLALVRNGGPPMLRIGGDSADHAFWSPARERPEWIFELSPAWLTEVRTLVQRTGARLILDLNLVTASPSSAARWARTAEARLPRNSIVALEIGNEPDIYSHSFWQDLTGAGGGARILPASMSATSYAQDFGAYAGALASAAPGVPLFGPALAEPARNLPWVSGLLAGPHPGLRAITVHRYPYSACAQPGSRSYPTIARVLSENATAGMARTIRAAHRMAARASLPMRLTEINSVTCGGTRGVSDTFATALWAPDALFELLRAGVASADVHVRARAINQAFALTKRGLVAHPLLYGMILFSRTLGADPHLIPLRLSAPPSSHLKAWAVRVRGGALHVLLIDKGSHSLRVTLHLPATGPAQAQRLLAPSIRSRWNLTLAGQRLSPSGTWHGRPVIENIAPGGHGYQLTIPRLSAALLTVHLRPGALAAMSARRRR